MGSEQSNWPLRILTRKALHSLSVNLSAGPFEFLEFRTQTWLSVEATSTQSPVSSIDAVLFSQDKEGGGTLITVSPSSPGARLGIASDRGGLPSTLQLGLSKTGQVRHIGRLYYLQWIQRSSEGWRAQPRLVGSIVKRCTFSRGRGCAEPVGGPLISSQVGRCSSRVVCTVSRSPSPGCSGGYRQCRCGRLSSRMRCPTTSLPSSGLPRRARRGGSRHVKVCGRAAAS